MIVCPNCKQIANITDEDIKPIYNDAGQIIRWEHKECDYNGEDSTPWNNKKRTK